MTKEEKQKEAIEEESAELGTCSECGSHKVELMTRVTGFFSKVNSWNWGKKAELIARRSAIEANVGAIAGSGGKLQKNEA